SIFEIIDDSELEAILIHEYYHIKEHRSLIFNVIAIFNSMFFFIPKFRIIQQLISNNEELEADRFAIASISNPLSLARALYKIFIVPSKNLSLNKLGNSRLNFSGNNIFAQRLTQIIQYSDEKRNLNR
ncbi:MAG: hypothetical protein GPJ54_02755, partial [Candidatus Heimdallarchaeota archaeon]|nr:hypothetical protein [Candidatus Heimdallarchaeota archaeon]